MKIIEHRACFNGWQNVYEHQSHALSCVMRFAVYLPPQAAYQSLPVVYFLSGLTCTEQNFITKAGAQAYAAKHGIILVSPDTSPRGEHVPNNDAYDLGQGAGFYINATQAPWHTHYHMHDYVHHELPELIDARFNTTGRRSIMGHSMGGHGALVMALKHPEQYQSVSAFAPIVAPTLSPWGKKAFMAYLGTEHESWLAWDSCHLVTKATQHVPMLVDQGGDDEFLGEQLCTTRLIEACQQHHYPANIRIQAGYDHSYYFISSFIGEHIEFHARHLK